MTLFGPGDTYNLGSSRIVGTDPIGYIEAAQAFSPAATGYISDIFAPVVPFFGGTFIFRVMSDNAGLPGNILESFSFATSHGSTPMFFHGIASGNALINAGEMYWFSVSAESGGGGWNLNSIGAISPLSGGRVNGGPWFTFSP